MGSHVGVSFGRTDITPPVGYPLAGFGVDSPRLADGVHSVLFARCVVLDDGAGPKVLVTADVLAIPRSMHQTIRAAVMRCGIASPDFVLTATHTHNGPALIERLDPYVAYAISDTAEIERYSEWLAGEIVDLVVRVLGQPRTPATLDYRCIGESFAVNRAHLSTVETDVPVLVARDDAGRPVVVLFGYGCHPVAAGRQSEFDADYPGHAVATVEARTAAFAQFLLGPAGDQNPAELGDWAHAHRYGVQLGLTVARAVEEPGRALAGPIGTSYTEVELPLDVPQSPQGTDEWKAWHEAYAARMEDFSKDGYYRRHAEVMLAELERGEMASCVPVPISVWSLAGEPPLRLALTGGELVCGYAVTLRAAYGGSARLWVAGYANEVAAYLPTDELLYGLAEGEYEAYEAGWNVDYPQLGGGSMTLYNWIGHFRGKPGPDAPDGVEQILLAAVTAQLGPA